MTDMQTFNRLLELQSVFKQLKQFSWNIKQLETRYDISIIEEEQLPILLRMYESKLDELETVLESVKKYKAVTE